MDENINSAIEKNRALDLDFKFIKLYSIKTGLCAENCSFCGQSRQADEKAKAKITKTSSPVEDFILAIDDALQNKADEILFVASGTRMSNKKELKRLAEGITLAKDKGLNVGLDLGLLKYDALQFLFDAGANNYVNSIQTARSFFAQMITSHTYEDKIRVLETAKKIGYSTGSGGILGLGETEEQRYEFADELGKLPCDSVGLSLFQPISGATMEHHTKMSSLEALEALALMRTSIEKPMYLMGGREKIIAQKDMNVCLQLVNGMTVGDYLFTKGEGIEKITSFLPIIKN